MTQQTTRSNPLRPVRDASADICHEDAVQVRTTDSLNRQFLVQSVLTAFSQHWRQWRGEACHQPTVDPVRAAVAGGTKEKQTLTAQVTWNQSAVDPVWAAVTGGTNVVHQCAQKCRMGRLASSATLANEPEIRQRAIPHGPRVGGNR